MDRREFFQTSIIGTPGGEGPERRHARSRPGACGCPRKRRVRPPPTPAPPARRLIMDAYTRNLHWLRTADEIAEAAIEMTCGGVNPTIQAYPGHIDPTKVAQELPAFVKTMQKHGLRVKQVRGGNQTAANAPNVEAMVAAMGQSASPTTGSAPTTTI